MKLLSVIVFAGLMAVGISACAKEEPKPAKPQVVQKEAKKETPKVEVQKADDPAIDAPKIKRACIDSKDKKGKDTQVCRNVKIHKKHEGTKVPEKAPAKK